MSYKLSPGDAVEWDNAYKQIEYGVVTRIASGRIYIEMQSLGGRPRARASEIFVPDEDLLILRHRKAKP